MASTEKSLTGRRSMCRRNTTRRSRRRGRPVRAPLTNCGTRSKESRGRSGCAGCRLHACFGPAAVVMAVIIGIGRRLSRGRSLVSSHHERVDDGHLVLQGNIDVRQVNLAFKVDGRIATLEVDEGDSVKAGQTVGHTRRSIFRRRTARRKAERDNAKAMLENSSMDRGPGNRRRQGASHRTRGHVGRALQDFKRFERLARRAASARRELDALSKCLARGRSAADGRQAVAGDDRSRAPPGGNCRGPGPVGRRRGQRHPSPNDDWPTAFWSPPATASC